MGYMIHRFKERHMHWQDVKNDWPDISKKARSNWNKLPEPALVATQGERAQIAALIQSYYGYSAEETDAQLDAWLQNLLGNTQHPVADDPARDEKLEANLDTPESIKKRDEIVGSPFHRTI